MHRGYWRGDEEDYRDLTSKFSYPLTEAALAMPSLWERLAAHVCHSSFREAVGSLRWKGLSDEEIASLYEDNRMRAYEEIYKDLLVQASVLSSAVEKGAASSNDWRWRSWQRDAETVASKMDTLEALLGSSLNRGSLPEVLHALGK